MPKLLHIYMMLLCLAVPISAQERLAIVIGNGAYQDVSLSKPAGNGIAVSHSLLGLGFDVIRLENVNAQEYQFDNRKANTVIIYFSGKVSTVNKKTILWSVEQNQKGDPSGWYLNDLVSGFINAGSKRVLVFLDVCHSELDLSKLVALPALEIDNVFQAQAMKPGTTCSTVKETSPDFTQQLIKALLRPNVPLSKAFQGTDAIWVSSSLLHPFILRHADEKIEGLTSADLEMLGRLSDEDRKNMLSLWRQAGIIEDNSAGFGESSSTVTIPKSKKTTILLTAQIKPVNIATPLKPVANIIPAKHEPHAVGGVRIFTAVASSTGPARQLQPTKAGLPKPSIIVGNIKSANASFNATEFGGALSRTEVGGTGFEARQKLRKKDPELFEQLLIGGAFDPLPEMLPAAIQTELARMGCYASRIDGVWGNGSRAAVDRYYKHLGENTLTRQPEVSLFRQLVRKDNVVCPVSRVQTRNGRVSSSPSRSTGTGSNKTRTQITKPRTTAKPATPTGPRTIKRTMNASGVFR